jgi:peptide/nickel transport system permease protein
MATYIARRVLWGVVLVILVSALTFLFFDILPSADPAVLRAGRNSGPATIAHIRQELGLNRPVYTQFFDYMKNIILHFNFGYSFYSGAPVLGLIKDRLPATLSLTVGAAVIWLLMGIPVGIISAIKRGSILDRVSMGVALVFVSMPVFWLGLVVLFLFAKDIGRFHVLLGANTYVGLTSNPARWFGSLLLPWFVLAATSAAIYSRVLRGSLIEAMGEDYIRTARAKGLRERTVVWVHGLRNSLIVVVTIVGLQLGALISGAVVTERIFALPGFGKLTIDAVFQRDYPVIQAVVLVTATAYIVINLLVDLLYSLIDPRIRVSGEAT